MIPESELTFAEAASVMLRRLASWASFIADGVKALAMGRAPTLFMAECMPPRAPGMSCTFVQTAVQPAWRIAVEREAGLADRQGRRLPNVHGVLWDNGADGGRIVCPGVFGRMRIVGPAETVAAETLPFGLAYMCRIWDLTAAEHAQVMRTLESGREER